jgi:hypothetical protein
VKTGLLEGLELEGLDKDVDPIHELNTRLETRKRLITQIGPVNIPEDQWQQVINRAKRPADVECKKVDTSQPVDGYIGDVIRYINR